MRRFNLQFLTLFIVLGLASSAQAVVTIVTTIDGLEGYRRLNDDGLGTVTLDEFVSVADNITDIGPDLLITVFGPGAFIFIDNTATTSITSTHPSNSSGIGAHGPSGTAPGETAEWGVVSGFVNTGSNFCLSSPVTICNQNGFAHGSTLPTVLPSSTYDLGTWNFDAEGDLLAETWYLTRTSNGGLSNNHVLVSGNFVGSALPALPLIGFGALALSLAVLGGRALVGKK